MSKTLLQNEIERQDVVLSVTNAIRYILEMQKGVREIHKKKLLSLMIWIITEADGLTAQKRVNYKYKITYISEGTKKKKDKLGEDGKDYIKGLVHEHVYRRKILVDKLLKNPEQRDSILKNAIGCIVTKEEDKRLREVDKEKSLDGWERYRKAGIKVYNTRDDKWRW